MPDSNQRPHHYELAAVELDRLGHSRNPWHNSLFLKAFLLDRIALSWRRFEPAPVLIAYLRETVVFKNLRQVVDIRNGESDPSFISV